MQKQRGIYNCGAFALAVCIALANGQDPSNLRWHELSLREKFREMILSEIISPLQTVQSNSQRDVVPKIPTTYTIRLWCLCRLPEYAFDNMVMCDHCKLWFHNPRIGLPDVS